jgi:predicted nucleotidyltransferase
MVEELSITQMAKRLLAAAPVGSEVILFGSYARGDATEESDLDFLVIEPEVGDRRLEMVRLRNELRGMPVGIDIIVVNREMFDEWRQTPNNTLHEAWKEGRVYREVG